MIVPGTQIKNKKTNTIHVVDGIEAINHETLVFTTDLKCFPILEIEKLETPNSESNDYDPRIVINLTNSIIQALHYDLPYVEKKPSFIEKIIGKILKISI
jgi:hypothetical protein